MLFKAEEGAAFDVESYSAQSFTKNVRTFFNKQQLNIQANATKKTIENWINAFRTCNRASQG